MIIVVVELHKKKKKKKRTLRERVITLIREDAFWSHQGENKQDSASVRSTASALWSDVDFSYRCSVIIHHVH